MKATLKRLAKRAAITGGLHAARIIGAAGLMQGARGRGAIFTLHHVRPKPQRSFDPNAHLEITPDFLDTAITRLKRDGYRFIALGDLQKHLTSDDRRPVAVFTLDDGYRNNLEFAAPVFTKHGVPFTVFVAGGFIDRTAILWWEVLADLLERNDSIAFPFDAQAETVRTGTLQEKQAAFDRIANFIGTGDEAAAIERLKDAAVRNGLDPFDLTHLLTLEESGLRALLDNPLASLGAHTISHRALSRLPDDAARDEMTLSARRVADITGAMPSALAYPYGYGSAVSSRDHHLVRASGFSAAVTTQPGTLSEASDLAALPRISLNGHFQSAGHVGALASGIPFRLMGA